MAMPAPSRLPQRRIDVTDLACRRGDRLLFSGLGFSVGAGQALLLRGPNGVGKTTLIRTLAGLLRPEAGTITIAGRDAEARPGTDMHLMAHLSAVKGRLTVAENLAFWRVLNGGAGDTASALAEVGLAPIADLEARHLSAGQERRLALARLIVSPRPIWLLDEPTAALDAEGEKLVGRLIDAHLDAGGCCIAATHLPIPFADAARITVLALGDAP
jgi:heme exporter protein A